MTTFDSIIEDYCLASVDDYKMVKLYKSTHGETPTLPISYWNDYVDGFMNVAINRFKPYCDNLEVSERSFVNDLKPLEQTVIILYWIIAWARREVNNSSQLQLKLKIPSGFSFSSEGSTLKAKQLWLDNLEEEANRAMTQYQLVAGEIGSYDW